MFVVFPKIFFFEIFGLFRLSENCLFFRVKDILALGTILNTTPINLIFLIFLGNSLVNTMQATF
jgi:hypothetical protein